MFFCLLKHVNFAIICAVFQGFFKRRALSVLKSFAIFIFLDDITQMEKYDVIIIGAGPGGIFSAYELSKLNRNLKTAVFEEGTSLEKRK